MRCAVAATLLLPIAALAPTPARAQTALDRVEPGRGERTGGDGPKDTGVARIAVGAPEPARIAAGDGAVMAGAISVVGLQAMKPADFADIMVERVGRTLDQVALGQLANAVAERARDRGYTFATAWIEPQRVAAGMLAVHLDEGAIDEIRFDGPAHSAVRAALMPLATGKPLTAGEIERRLLIAGDIDGVRITGSRYLRQEGRGVLIVRVAVDPVTARAQLSNEGTKPLGPIQARIDVDFNAFLATDDSFSITYSTTPTEPRELQFGRGRYAKRIDANGTELTLTGSASLARPGAYLDGLDLESRSWSVAAGVFRPLWRRRDASVFLEAELGFRNLKQQLGGVLIRDDRVATLRLGTYGFADVAGGRMRVSATATRGLGILDATRLGDPFASRFDADGTFTSLSVWSDWTRDLGDRFSLRLAVQSQIASDPLLVSEEAGLGGTDFLRGYDWSERTGDKAAMGMAELRYTWSRPFGAMQRAQLYAFVDGGKVTNIGPATFGSGELASTGGGIRADLTNRFGATLEAAVPLTGPRYDTGGRDPKVNFRLQRAF